MVAQGHVTVSGRLELRLELLTTDSVRWQASAAEI